MNNQDPNLKVSVCVSMFYFMCFALPSLASLI